MTLILQIKEATESWKHNSPLNIISFEICTPAALDYLKITHLAPHDSKDNFKSLKYSITSTTLKRHTGVNVLLKQNPQETNHWSTSVGTGLAPVVCHKMKSKATFTNKSLSGYQYILFTF